MVAIGIDSGTQGTKALVVDFDGNVLGRGYAEHKSVPGLKPGESEQDPSVWDGALENSLKEALKSSGISPGQVESLGISAQQHGFVPIDRTGNPLRPAKLWNDTSTLSETQEILQALGGKESFINKVGINLAVGFTASKILWLKKTEPASFNKTHTILLPHNYLNFKLTGRRVMEYGDASGTGIMNITTRGWSSEACVAIDAGLSEKLPEIKHPLEPVGFMSKERADRFGFTNVLVSSGGGDNMMAAIGTGNVERGIVTLSLGTSGTIYSYSDSPFIDPEGEIASFCDSSGGWLPLLCTMNVTNTTELLKDVLGLDNRGLESSAGEAEAGSMGLIFLPFIDGERVPPLPLANGVLFGLTRNNFNQSCLARSVMEGTVLNLGYGFSRMKALDLIPQEIRATGGGANSRLWLQIVSDCFSTPVVTLKEQEAGAYGAALQSIWCWFNGRGDNVSLKDITDRMIKKGPVSIEPDVANKPIYTAAQERFNSLWKSLKPEFSSHRPVEESDSG